MSKARTPDQYEKISLPLQVNGETVCHTFQGEWLVGIASPDDDSGRPLLSHVAGYKYRQQWGEGYWFVIRSASGKLVVYRQPLGERDNPRTIAIYDSFEAMQPNVPPNIFDEAAQKAGLKAQPKFREVPLEGV